VKQQSTTGGFSAAELRTGGGGEGGEKGSRLSKGPACMQRVT